MLAPNPNLSYNGRPRFANPKYLKKAQSEKPCLYKTPYDKDDLANIFAPNRKETLTLEEESRSKLDKETIKSRENAYEFENALKQKMFEDLEYIQSLEKEVDEPEYEEAEFSNEYDLLLQESVSKDIMCSILRSFESLDKKNIIAMLVS
ncbi:hypothetical protein Tco_0956887 [Tanacetum coccineum]